MRSEVIPVLHHVARVRCHGVVSKIARSVVGADPIPVADNQTGGPVAVERGSDQAVNSSPLILPFCDRLTHL